MFFNVNRYNLIEGDGFPPVLWAFRRSRLNQLSLTLLILWIQLLVTIRVNSCFLKLVHENYSCFFLHTVTVCGHVFRHTYTPLPNGPEFEIVADVLFHVSSASFSKRLCLNIISSWSFSRQRAASTTQHHSEPGLSRCGVVNEHGNAKITGI